MRIRDMVVLVKNSYREKCHLKRAAIMLGRATINSKIALQLTLRSNICVLCRPMRQVAEGTDCDPIAETNIPWRQWQIIM
jgi:hypothetical protein